MELQEAKNLSIGETVFIIDSHNIIYRKEVTGVKLAGIRELDVSCTKPGNNLFSRANNEEYTLSYEDVFLKESDAWKMVLRVKKSEATSIKNAVKYIQKRLRKALESEAT